MRLKKFIKFCTIVFALLFFICAPLWKISKLCDFQFFGEIINRVDTSLPYIALTFDDGPTRKYTPLILKMLRERNIKATFFITGKEAEENPDMLSAIINEGHEIGNHSYSHKRLILKTPAFIKKEVDKTFEIIKKAKYTGEIFFRPPYGIKLFFLPWYLEKSNIKTIMWDIEPESYPELAASVEKMSRYVIGNTRAGSIILLHPMYENRETTRVALPLIIDGLLKREFRFTRVSELLKLNYKLKR